MPVYKAEAIVIRRTNLGEADRVVTLFCRDQGKLAAAAKGARKPGSRFAGRLELFSSVRVLLAVGRTLDVVSQVEVVDAFGALRDDLGRLGHAALAVELVDRATADRESAPELFGSLQAALELVRSGDPEQAALWFTTRLLVHSGYAPATDHCQVCGKPVHSAVFSSALGGVLCEAHANRDLDAVMASASALRTIGHLPHLAPEGVGRLVLDGRLRGEVGGLLYRYVEYRLETKLKSLSVIRKTTGNHRGGRGDRSMRENADRLPHPPDAASPGRRERARGE
jgi:DNA repair protein RecO (recombination protein O)